MEDENSVEVGRLQALNLGAESGAPQGSVDGVSGFEQQTVLLHFAIRHALDDL
jgi:hypothetical protein